MLPTLKMWQQPCLSRSLLRRQRRLRLRTSLLPLPPLVSFAMYTLSQFHAISLAVELLLCSLVSPAYGIQSSQQVHF